MERGKGLIYLYSWSARTVVWVSPGFFAGALYYVIQ